MTAAVSPLSMDAEHLRAQEHAALAMAIDDGQPLLNTNSRYQRPSDVGSETTLREMNQAVAATGAKPVRRGRRGPAASAHVPSATREKLKPMSMASSMGVGIASMAFAGGANTLGPDMTQGQFGTYDDFNVVNLRAKRDSKIDDVDPDVGCNDKRSSQMYDPNKARTTMFPAPAPKPQRMVDTSKRASNVYASKQSSRLTEGQKRASKLSPDTAYNNSATKYPNKKSSHHLHPNSRQTSFPQARASGGFPPTGRGQQQQQRNDRPSENSQRSIDTFDTDHTYTGGNTQRTTSPAHRKKRVYGVLSKIAGLFDRSGKTKKKYDAKRYAVAV